MAEVKFAFRRFANHKVVVREPANVLPISTRLLGCAVGLILALLAGQFDWSYCSHSRLGISNEHRFIYTRC